MKQAIAVLCVVVMATCVWSASVVVDGVTWYYGTSQEKVNGQNVTCAYITSGTAKYVGNLTIPSKLGGCPVTSIGSGAFSDCNGLTSVTIPVGVTNIGSSAFSGCHWLTSVTIPSSVTGIGGSAFRLCGKLTKIVVDVDNPRYKSIDNCLLSKDGVALIRGPGSGSVVIPKGVTSIGDHAFESSGLTSVIIPEGVTNIGACAFSACNKLTSVTIPKGVTSIGRGSFYGSRGLTSVTIPSSVTSIGAEAFQCCHKLTSVTIPDGVTSIGGCAFCNCYGLTSVTIPVGVTNIGSSAFSGCQVLTSVAIPSGVTSIRGGTFYNCYGLTSVTIPTGVTDIGRSAFSGCSNLTSVTIPSSVTSIGRGAFDSTAFYEKQEKGMVILGGGVLYKFKGECSSSVTIPSRVASIEDFAFSGCEGLTSVTIPSSVTSIGSSAFSRCRELTKIVVDVDNPRYKSIDNCLLSKDGATLIRGPVSKSVVIPKNVTIIGGSAFSGCSRMTSVMIPSGVTSIGRGSFSDCHGLTSVAIPAGVTNIGSSAFSGCKGLTSVKIPTSVTCIGQEAFYGCRGLTSVVIPSDMTNVVKFAFRRDGELLPSTNGMTTVVFTKPKDVRRPFVRGVGSSGNAHPVRRSRRKQDEQMAAVDSITNSMMGIEKKIRGLKGGRGKINVEARSVEQQECVDGYTWSYRVSNGEATIRSVSPKPTGVVSIPRALGGAPVTEIDLYARVFQECEGLTSVTIPSSMRNRKVSGRGGSKVGLGSVFSECDNLKQIIVEKDSQCYASVDGVLYTKDLTELVRCPGGATSITILESVTCIGDSAFSCCKGLTSITMPHSVTNIGGGAFSSCAGLTSVTIPKSVTRIENFAFTHCAGLTSVLIPSGVTHIGGGAFADCAKLSQINVEAGNPKYVSVDGVLYTKDLKVLVQCPGGAKTVTILKDVTKIGWRAFDGCNNLASVAIPPSVASIESVAFSGCGKLTSVIIPSSVTNVGWFAFSSCAKLKQINAEKGNQNYASVDGVLYTKDMTELIRCPDGATSITIPNGVTQIGKDSFSNCKGLMAVTIPPSVTNIGFDAFRGCSALTSVTIPPSVTSIGFDAFRGCSGLKSVTIPSSVRSIGESAFFGCSGLADSDGFVIVNDILYGYQGNAAAVTIPSNVTNIAKGAFDGCSGLKSVTIPSSVSKVGWSAFDGCTGLTSVTLRGERPRSIGVHEFRNCKKLSAIHVPANAKSWAGMKEWQGIPLVFDGAKADEKIEGDKSTHGKSIVAEKLQSCDFLLNKDFKKTAKFYLCLSSASWCPPCRREMPRIAKAYAETLKDDPDIELIHFSRDQNDDKALAWAKEHDVKFPVVKPKGGNPLDLHYNGIPHLFIVKDDGTLLEEGHPMRLFTDEKLRALKDR